MTDGFLKYRISQQVQVSKHGSSDVGVQDSSSSVRAGSVWISSIEAIPPKPEHTCPDQHDKNVVGLEIDSIALEAGTDPVCADEASCAR
jgi:hypothetical protein